ncbi:peptidoglycan-associated lipoprotein Pal [Thermodesulfobacteriota bacterium]
MRKKMWISLALLLVIPGLLFTASCAKKTVKSDAAMTAEAEAAKQKAIEEEGLKEGEIERAVMAAKKMFVNEDVYFEYDRYDLLPSAQEVLRKKAEWLDRNSTVPVYIEGHCDERGTNEYNLALGDRRAEAAKAFLVDLGISSSRLTTISYGEERPIDSGLNEEAFSKNRRAHFVIE